MQQSKYVVVEVATTTATMTLVQYLITHGFDKFAVVADLCDHPSLKYKSGTNANGGSCTNGSSTNGTASPTTNGKQKISINDIANALSQRTSPSENNNPKSALSISQSPVTTSFPATPIQQKATPTQLPASQPQHSTLARILEEKSRMQLEQQREQERQQLEIQRIILAGAESANQKPRGAEPVKIEPQSLEEGAESPELLAESPIGDEASSLMEGMDCGLGTSDPSEEQIRAAMDYLTNPAIMSAFGSRSVEPTPPSKKKTPPPKKLQHRWMTSNELEESRFGRGKNYGRVHCKATYKCELCGKPTTLNSTGSRWNLLRHVIMIHSESKPYQCLDCDFIGIKSNVISHARQCGHRNDDAQDITTDDMRTEWNHTLHRCFPEYVKAKSRGWQSERECTQKEESADSASLSLMLESTKSEVVEA